MPAAAERARDPGFSVAEVPTILRLARIPGGQSITKRTIDKLIDSDTVPRMPARGKVSKRRLRAEAVHVAAAEFTLRLQIPVPSMRRQGFHDYLRFGGIASRLWVSDDVSVDIEDTVKRVDTAIRRYMRLMNLIVTDPDVQRGEPVIRGTRITAYTIAEIARQGVGIDEILQDYPTLDAEKIEAACLYADAHPRRGRPVLPKAAKDVFRISVNDVDKQWSGRR